MTLVTNVFYSCSCSSGSRWKLNAVRCVIVAVGCLVFKRPLEPVSYKLTGRIVTYMSATLELVRGAFLGLTLDVSKLEISVSDRFGLLPSLSCIFPDGEMSKHEADRVTLELRGGQPPRFGHTVMSDYRIGMGTTTFAILRDSL